MVTLSELAAALNYEYVGNPAAPITTIAFSQEAQSAALAIVQSEKEILSTQAKIVLTIPRVIKTKKSLLFSGDPIELGAVRAAKFLIQQGLLPNYNTAETYKSLKHSMVGERCMIGNRSIIQPFSVIGSGTKIGKDCIIEPYVWIGRNVELGDHVTIHTGAKIGIPAFYHYWDKDLQSFPGIGTVQIGNHVEIGSQTAIQRGTFSNTIIRSHTKIGDFVEIGHDVHIGCSCKIVSQTGIAGNVTIGDFVQIYGQVGIANGVQIEDRAIIMAKTTVTKNIAYGKTVWGIFGRDRLEELRIQAIIRKRMGGK